MAGQISYQSVAEFWKDRSIERLRKERNRYYWCAWGMAAIAAGNGIIALIGWLLYLSGGVK